MNSFNNLTAQSQVIAGLPDQLEIADYTKYLEEFFQAANNYLDQLLDQGVLNGESTLSEIQQAIIVISSTWNTFDSQRFFLSEKSEDELHIKFAGIGKQLIEGNCSPYYLVSFPELLETILFTLHSGFGQSVGVSSEMLMEFVEGLLSEAKTAQLRIRLLKVVAELKIKNIKDQLGTESLTLDKVYVCEDQAESALLDLKEIYKLVENQDAYTNLNFPARMLLGAIEMIDDSLIEIFNLIPQTQLKANIRKLIADFSVKTMESLLRFNLGELMQSDTTVLNELAQSAINFAQHGELDELDKYDRLLIVVVESLENWRPQSQFESLTILRFHLSMALQYRIRNNTFRSIYHWEQAKKYFDPDGSNKRIAYFMTQDFHAFLDYWEKLKRKYD